MTAPATTRSGELLDAAKAIAPRVAELADQIERERALLPELVEAFRSAGFFHATVPAAIGGVEADPVTKPPVTEASLNAMYTNFVKEALMDAIIDTGGVLILADAEKLVVTASGDDVLTSQLQRLNTRQLVLTIKGIDLNALRSGRITREQARDRIAVQAF